MQYNNVYVTSTFTKAQIKRGFKSSKTKMDNLQNKKKPSPSNPKQKEKQMPILLS